MSWGLTSCKKAATNTFSDLPVIQSYIYPGEKISVKISQKTRYEESAAVTVTDLNKLDVRVIAAGTEYTLVPAGDGVYTDTLGNIKVIPDSTYSLRIVYNGTLVTSTTLIPTKPASVKQSATSITMKQFDPANPSFTTQPEPVVITFANPKAGYYIATVLCMDTVQVPVIKDSVPSNDMLASQPSTGTEISIHPMMIRYFGKNRIILYHINPEYSTFFMRQASTSQSYQEPPTNIVNGLGIFTGINADTLYLNVIKN